jgi:hypothetical protein
VKNGADVVDIYLCPKSFLDDMALLQQGRRHRAHRAEDKTERAYLILARELVKGDVTLMLRDGKNNPVWS